MKENNKVLGNKGEGIAALFLQNHGYRILERNFRCPGGEIDLIVVNAEVLAFVEVKTRSSLKYGRPCEAVDRNKQRHMIMAAQLYLRSSAYSNYPLRFDVVEVLRMPGGQLRVNHIKGAFEAC